MADWVAAVHSACIPYCLLGWIVPYPLWLKVHAAFVPTMVVHWWFNRNVCILSNVESYLRHGQWWRRDDADQGAWVENKIRALTGWTPPAGFSTLATYVALAASTAASIIHLRRLG